MEKSSIWVGERFISLKKLADLLIHISGGTYIFREFPVNHKRIDVGDYYADFSAIQETLGWTPKTDIEVV